jgi:sulfonate transport system substrate-binding protein
MAMRNGALWHRLILFGSVLFLAGVIGCRMRAPSAQSGEASLRLDPTRVYAQYRFDSAPTVLNFGVQPLWIPTCVIWEVMARDPHLQEDLRRARFRLDAYPFFKGRDLDDYLRAGKLQGGIVGDLPALKSAAEADVRIVSLIQQGPCTIVARTKVPLEQLRGRKIGYAPGSNAHYTLVRALGKHRLRPVDVQLVPMEVTNMAEALAARQIDAFSAWEPTPTQALVNHPSFEILHRMEARGYIYFTRRFFERHPAVVRAVVASEIRALRWLRKNDRNLYIASRWAWDKAAAFQGAELPSTAYDFLRLAKRDLLREPTAPRLLPELLAPPPTAFIPGEVSEQFRLSQQFDLIPASASWDRVRQSFTDGLVPQILGAAARFQLDELIPS